jgi:hypothetical protein
MRTDIYGSVIDDLNEKLDGHAIVGEEKIKAIWQFIAQLSEETLAQWKIPQAPPWYEEPYE